MSHASRFGAVALVGCLGMASCGPPKMADLYDRSVLRNEMPDSYSDRDWATVLRENVKENRVDYEHLKTHREPLDRYIALIAAVGPKSNESWFQSPDAQLAYYVNAYNACVLAAVLHEELPQSMHLPDGRRLDYNYRFLVDGEVRTLGDLRQLIGGLGELEPRLEFCLCDAALGSPPLPAAPFQAETLDRQVREAARAAMENPAMVRIDHGNTRLEVSMLIAEHRADFLEFYRRQTGSRDATLLSALLYMASDACREQLNTAVGYEDGLIAFDRALNIWHRTEESPASDTVAEE